MPSSMKITVFELRCKYDDLLSLCRSHGGMELYLQLMLFPTMIEKLGSCTILKSYLDFKIVGNEIQTKENAFMWTLTVIYISKMASYEVGVIL